MVLRYGDLVLLALALPAFLIAGWPMLGYVVAAGAAIAAPSWGSWARPRSAECG